MNIVGKRFIWGVLFVFVLLIVGCSDESFQTETYIAKDEETKVSLDNLAFDYEAIPKYDGHPYIEINDNIPFFTEEELTTESFEDYGELDHLGRCTASSACLSIDTMPTEEDKRGNIGNIKPTGWFSTKYECVEGKYVMNRCHCIAWQLSNENDNILNLVSGSRYLNLEMLSFENMVADYLIETRNHVMYRVTPVFVEEEMLCRGLLMEGYSVEDDGEGISYCVFIYNVQPGIEFDYLTGESWYTGVFLDTNSKAVNFDGISDSLNTEKVTYILNRNSKKFHLESCSSVSTISEHNKELFEGNRDYLISIGYEPCGSCHP